jgi:hypothetical protein
MSQNSSNSHVLNSPVLNSPLLNSPVHKNKKAARVVYNEALKVERA